MYPQMYALMFSTNKEFEKKPKTFKWGWYYLTKNMKYSYQCKFYEKNSKG